MNREGEDFYYMHTLIEVVADNPDTLEQRLASVETLCVASDMLAKRCEFKHEQAFLSFLPLLMTDPDIAASQSGRYSWPFSGTTQIIFRPCSRRRLAMHWSMVDLPAPLEPKAAKLPLVYL